MVSGPTESLDLRLVSRSIYEMVLREISPSLSTQPQSPDLREESRKMQKRAARRQISRPTADVERAEADDEQETFWLDTARASADEIARRQILVPKGRLGPVNKGERITNPVRFAGSERFTVVQALTSVSSQNLFSSAFQAPRVIRSPAPPPRTLFATAATPAPEPFVFGGVRQRPPAFRFDATSFLAGPARYHPTGIPVPRPRQEFQSAFGLGRSANGGSSTLPVSGANSGQSTPFRPAMPNSSFSFTAAAAGPVVGPSSSTGRPTFTFGEQSDTPRRSDRLNVGQPSCSKPEARECSICCDGEISAALVPCGHTYCFTCADRLRGTKKACPVCRKAISQVQRLYL